MELDAYRAFVYGSFRDLRDGPDARWGELAARLGGGGVHSLDEALADLRLAPVHEAATALLAPGLDAEEVTRRRATLLERAGVTEGAGASGRASARSDRAATPLPADRDLAVRAAGLLRPIDRATFDRLRLATAFRASGFDDEAIARTRLALALARPSQVRDAPRLAVARLQDTDVRTFLGVNESEGVEWFKKEAFEALLTLATALDRAAGATRASPAIGKLRAAAQDAGYRLDLFLANLEKPATPSSRRSRPRSS